MFAPQLLIQRMDTKPWTGFYMGSVGDDMGERVDSVAPRRCSTREAMSYRRTSNGRVSCTLWLLSLTASRTRSVYCAVLHFARG